jgi:hypothetical protein
MLFDLRYKDVKLTAQQVVGALPQWYTCIIGHLHDITVDPLITDTPNSGHFRPAMPGVRTGRSSYN